MYFHSVAKTGQVSYMVTSPNGLTFGGPCQPSEGVAPFYLRTFYVDGEVYGIAKVGNEGGVLLRQTENGKFSRGPRILNRMRHAAVIVHESVLSIFYTRIGDAPERILMSCVDLRSPWETWKPRNERTILIPEGHSEGENYEPTPSTPGMATKVRQLRDPFVLLTNNGNLFLFFSFAGEEGIRVSELDPRMVSFCP